MREVLTTALRLAILFVVWFHGAAAICAAQPPPNEGPVFRTKKGFDVSAGIVRSVINPHLPRDLKNHENHVDDAFLIGSPGETDLDRVEVDSLELRIGTYYRLGYRNLALIAAYTPKFPLRTDGRLEMQQLNDPRPAAMGSFVYASVPDVGLEHSALAGLAFASRLSEKEDWWLQAEPAVEIGRWPMTFEKGWSRFGRDQAAITSAATGFNLSPRLNITLRTSRWSVYMGTKYVRVRFTHQPAHLEAHTGSGFAFSFGGAFHGGF